MAPKSMGCVLQIEHPAFHQMDSSWNFQESEQTDTQAIAACNQART